jgi:hypothetical protein
MHAINSMWHIVQHNQSMPGSQQLLVAPSCLCNEVRHPQHKSLTAISSSIVVGCCHACDLEAGWAGRALCLLALGYGIGVTRACHGRRGGASKVQLVSSLVDCKAAAAATRSLSWPNIELAYETSRHSACRLYRPRNKQRAWHSCSLHCSGVCGWQLNSTLAALHTTCHAIHSV